MATPQPETDNSFTRRAALQSPVALGPAAGGEKTAAADVEATKPAPRTSFAAAAALNSPLPSLGRPSPAVKTASAPTTGDTPQAAHAVEKAAPASVPDWGLPKKKPRSRLTLKLFAAGLTLACAAGGYFAYRQYFEIESAAPGETADAAGAERDLTGDDDAESLSSLDSPRDPFDDDLPGRTVGDKAPAQSEPARIGRSPDAQPIAGRKSPERPRRQHPVRESLSLDDDNVMEVAEEADSPQSESSAADVVEEAPVRSRERGFDPSRQPGSRTASDAGPNRTAIRSPQGSSGPRLPGGIDSGQDDDELPDERFGGYTAAGQRARPVSRKNAGGSAISIVEAQDDEEQIDKLDGYVPQSVTTRRASSKTVVVRPAESLDDDALHSRGALDYRPSRPGPSSHAGNGLRSASTLDSRLSSGSGFSSGRDESSEPSSGTYRVLPDDNFWKISRSLYGTSRYYQALMRHNRERVPDPQKLRPGTQIVTPPAAVLEQRYPELIDPPAASTPPAGGAVNRAAKRPAFEAPVSIDEPDDRLTRIDREDASSGYFYGRNGEPLYRIGADDTLSSIAQRHLGRASRWHEIFEKNQDVLNSPDNLTLGTVIRLPADASRLGLAPEAVRRR